MRPPRGGGGGFRGGRDGGRGRGGRFGGGGGRGFGRGGGGFRDEGPPAEVVEVSTFLHACEGDAVTKLTNEKIPYFNAPIYLLNKTQIGKVDEIFGPINESYFSIKMMEGIVATSYNAGDKFYIDPSKLLPLSRFLPQPKGQPQAAGRGGRGGGRGGSRGGGRGGARGRGAPRGGRGGFSRGGGRGGGFRGRGRVPLLLPMACLSDEGWCSAPKIFSTRLSLNEEPRDGDAAVVKEVESDDVDPFQFPVEKLFPVYAMVGFSGTDFDSVLSVPNSGPDPIWEAVREEAKLEAEKEPIISSFLYASILAHDCLEQALAFVLANRLQNPTLLATQLMDIFSDVLMNKQDIQRSVRLDVQAFKDRDPACLSYCSALLYLKGYHSLQSYRVAHALWKQGRTVLAFALQSRISEVFGIDIHPAATIGDGILLDHGTGVVIGETAVIGNRVSLMHGVTLGGTGKEIGDRHPKVGEGALIGACVTILGNIKIGEGAMIGAGSLVLKEVPPHSMIAGTPAKVIGYVGEEDPSLTMNHDAGKDFFQHVAVTFREGRPSGAMNKETKWAIEGRAEEASVSPPDYFKK